MATTTNASLVVTLGYTNTDFQRQYKFTDLEIGSLSNAQEKILAYNADIPAADKKVFISDDYDDTDPSNIIGEFSGIVAAYSKVDVDTDINLNV